MSGRRSLLAVLVALVALAGAASSARAGTWTQVSCVNPNGSASNSEGWSGTSSQTTNGSSVDARCEPGMSAEVGPPGTDPVNAYEALQYTPPAGSTLVGATLDVNLQPYGDGPDASATATVYGPTFVFPADALLFCANGQNPCSSQGDGFDGTYTTPADLGGDLYVVAACGGADGGTCNTAPAGAPYALAQVRSAQLELSDGAVPVAGGFTGTLLQRGARRTADVLFTASDPSGPGVYSVTATVNGRTVYAGTPNTNDGACVAVGSGAGGLMFDSQQPCPTAESVTIPVNTRTLPDGRDHLQVSVTDAAGNVATVLDRSIDVVNPLQTPRPRRGVQTRFELHWHWVGATTRLNAISVRRLARDGRVSIRVTGPRRPRLRHPAATGRHVASLLRELRGLRVHAGDRVYLTVTQRHHRTERIEVTIRDGRKPTARLL